MLEERPLPEAEGPEAEGGPALAEAIRRRAREFDAPALIALLRAKFSDRSLRFRGHASLATQPTLVHAVDFAPDHVTVTLNLGLQSSTSPLPSYFHELLAHPRAGPALAGILALLDDRLLRDRIDGLRPELAERLLPRAPAVRRDALALARLTSPATLHWLFTKVFPELGVTVRRAPVRRGMLADEPCLGHAVLGHAALGGEVEVNAPGFDVILCAEESAAWSGEPWSVEAPRRLSTIVFAALRDESVLLRVILVDREGKGRLELFAPSQLGFDPLERASTPKITILFEGRAPPA